MADKLELIHVVNGLPDSDNIVPQWNYIRNTMWKLEINGMGALASLIDKLIKRDLAELSKYDLEDLILKATLENWSP